MKSYGDAGRRVAAWVSNLVAPSTGMGRWIRFVVVWPVASLWLIGLVIAVSGLYIGRSGRRMWRITRVRNDIRKAQRRHRSAIKKAEKTVRLTEKTYAKDVGLAEKRLHALESPLGARLATYRSIQLYELGIVTPQGTSNLEGAQALVDATGNVAVTQRATLTRMGAGAVLAGPVGLVAAGVAGKKKKRHDFRELYLSIQTPTMSYVVKCNPNDGLKARTFAGKVNSAAQRAGSIRARRPQQIAAARDSLQLAQAATAPLEAARADLERVRADASLLGTIETARSRLALETGRPVASE